MVQADHTFEHGRIDRLTHCLVFHALQVVHLVSFLPREKNRGDDDKEHVEGHLEVDLLPSDCLIVQISFSAVGSHDEAHDCRQSQSEDHAVHGVSQKEVIDLSPNHHGYSHHDTENEDCAKYRIHVEERLALLYLYSQ